MTSRARVTRSAGLGPPELQIEVPELDLLARVRLPVDVALQAVGLDRLDDRDPRQVLEGDPPHLLVGLAAEALVDAEPRGGAQVVEARMPPVVHRPARR